MSLAPETFAVFCQDHEHAFFGFCNFFTKRPGREREANLYAMSVASVDRAVKVLEGAVDPIHNFGLLRLEVREGEARNCCKAHISRSQDSDCSLACRKVLHVQDVIGQQRTIANDFAKNGLRLTFSHSRNK